MVIVLCVAYFWLESLAKAWLLAHRSECKLARGSRQLPPLTLLLSVRFSEEPLFGHCVHRPLFPAPALLDFASLHLSPGTWLFWPQTGPDCQCLSVPRPPLCPPIPVDDVAVFSFWFLSSLSFLVLSPFPLVFGGLCPFPASRLSASPPLSLLVFRLFPLTPLVLTGPGFLCSRSPSFPLC